MKYRIYANNYFMGIYEGDAEDQALDAYAMDAGYKDFQDLLDSVPGSTREEVEVTAEV